MVYFPVFTGAHPELEYLRRELRRGSRNLACGGVAGQQTPSLQQRVAAEIKARRERERRFGAVLFSDPAWDMLLALYEAHLRSKSMSATDLCIASTAPAGVALRWISVLEREQLLIQLDEPSNPCKVRLELSARAINLMGEHFGVRSSGSEQSRTSS